MSKHCVFVGLLQAVGCYYPLCKSFFTRPRSLEVVFKVHSCHLSNLDLVMNRFNIYDMSGMLSLFCEFFFNVATKKEQYDTNIIQ